MSSLFHCACTLFRGNATTYLGYNCVNLTKPIGFRIFSQKNRIPACRSIWAVPDRDGGENVKGKRGCAFPFPNVSALVVPLDDAQKKKSVLRQLTGEKCCLV